MGNRLLDISLLRRRTWCGSVSEEFALEFVLFGSLAAGGVRLWRKMIRTNS